MSIEVVNFLANFSTFAKVFTHLHSNFMHLKNNLMIRYCSLITACLLLNLSLNASPNQAKTPAKAQTKPAPKTAKTAPAKPAAKPANKPAEKPALQAKKGTGKAKDLKNKKDKSKRNSGATDEDLLIDLLRERVNKKRKNTQDKKLDEYLILTAKALIDLKKKYRDFPVERNFDDRINAIIQKYAQEGGSMPSKTRDSIIQVYAVNYIQTFDLQKKGELNALTDQLFSSVNLNSGKHSNPVVIQRLNKVVGDDKDKKMAIVREELSKLIFETWKLEIVTLLNKYQIVVQ